MTAGGKGTAGDGNSTGTSAAEGRDRRLGTGCPLVPLPALPPTPTDEPETPEDKRSKTKEMGLGPSSSGEQGHGVAGAQRIVGMPELRKHKSEEVREELRKRTSEEVPGASEGRRNPSRSSPSRSSSVLGIHIEVRACRVRGCLCARVLVRVCGACVMMCVA